MMSILEAVKTHDGRTMKRVYLNLYNGNTLVDDGSERGDAVRLWSERNYLSFVLFQTHKISSQEFFVRMENVQIKALLQSVVINEEWKETRSELNNDDGGRWKNSN